MVVGMRNVLTGAFSDVNDFVEDDSCNFQFAGQTAKNQASLHSELESVSGTSVA